MRPILKSVGCSGILGFAWILSGCGGSANVSARFSSNLLAGGSSQASVALRNGASAAQAATGSSASSPFSVTSLQLNIQSIELIDTSGKFKTILGGVDSNTMTIADAMAGALSDSWVDVVDQNSIRTFTTRAKGAIPAGTYSEIWLGTRKPWRLNASVSFRELGGSQKSLKTCSGGSIRTVPRDSHIPFDTELVQVPDMTSCSQSLVTLGSTAPMQRLKLSEPFRIEEKKEYVLDLIVHPEAMLLVSRVTDPSRIKTGLVDGTYNIDQSAQLPLPIIREVSQKTVREEYSITCDDSIGRTVYLYFVGEQSGIGQSALRGAQVFTSYGGDGSVAVSAVNVGKLGLSNGAVDLFDIVGGKILSGLERSRADTPGNSAGNVTVYQGQGSQQKSCTASYVGLKVL